MYIILFLPYHFVSNVIVEHGMGWVVDCDGIVTILNVIVKDMLV